MKIYVELEVSDDFTHSLGMEAALINEILNDRWRWHSVRPQTATQISEYGSGDGNANALLISAAPDLLDALRRMVESVTGVDQVSAVNEARAAIAKATGCAA